MTTSNKDRSTGLKFSDGATSVGSEWVGSVKDAFENRVNWIVWLANFKFKFSELESGTSTEVIRK